MTMIKPIRRARYDWEEWIDGKVHTAKFDEDFHCQPASFVALLHSKAKGIGMEVATKTSSADGTEITFQFFTRDEDTDNDGSTDKGDA